MNNVTVTKRPHKTTWTVKEVLAKANDAETSSRWTTTQVRVLVARIAELEEREKQLVKERAFLMTLLDQSKTNNDSIRMAAEMVGLRLPKKSAKSAAK